MQPPNQTLVMQVKGRQELLRPSAEYNSQMVWSLLRLRKAAQNGFLRMRTFLGRRSFFCGQSDDARGQVDGGGNEIGSKQQKNQDRANDGDIGR